jgi:hypothetical protein
MRASINLSRLWCKQDRRGEATEGFDATYLKEAKALLDELHA